MKPLQFRVPSWSPSHHDWTCVSSVSLSGTVQQHQSTHFVEDKKAELQAGFSRERNRKLPELKTLKAFGHSLVKLRPSLEISTTSCQSTNRQRWEPVSSAVQDKTRAESHISAPIPADRAGIRHSLLIHGRRSA